MYSKIKYETKKYILPIMNDIDSFIDQIEFETLLAVKKEKTKQNVIYTHSLCKKK